MMSPQQMEALLLLHDAETREDVVVWSSTMTHRSDRRTVTGKYEWTVNGPTARSLERRGLLRYKSGPRGNVELTAAGCGEAADLAAKR